MAGLRLSVGEEEDDSLHVGRHGLSHVPPRISRPALVQPCRVTHRLARLGPWEGM